MRQRQVTYLHLSVSPSLSLSLSVFRSSSLSLSLSHYSMIRVIIRFYLDDLLNLTPIDRGELVRREVVEVAAAGKSFFQLS